MTRARARPACGMFTSAFLTLLVVPVFYIGLDNLAEGAVRRLRRLFSGGEPAGVADSAH